MNAYLEGWKARENTIPKDKCPYLPCSQEQEFQDWIQGWNDAYDNDCVEAYYDRLYQ